MLARETDLLNDYLDRVFAEGFIETAWFRKSLIEMGRLVGYLPNLASAATVTLTLTRIDEVTGDITIPQYTEFTRVDGLGYLTTEEVTMLAAEDSVTVDAIQGEIVTDTYAVEEFTLDGKTGNYTLDLGANVASGTTALTHGVDPVVTWTEVDSFYRSLDTDAHFLLLVDGDTDYVTLTIGNGTKGMTPPSDVDLTITFIRTGCADGNAGANIITTIPTSLLAYVTCTNTDVASGGANAESIDELREQIPAVTRTQRRAVTTEDYVALAEKIPGVLDVHCVDRNTDRTFPHNYVVLYVLPEGGGAMSEALKADIWEELQEWGHLGAWEGRYLLYDPTEVAVNVTCRVGIEQGYNVNTVLTAVRTAIADQFSITNITIGDALEYSVIFDAVLAVSGVSWVDFSEPVSTVTPGVGEILVVGTVTVTQGQ